MKSSDSGSTKNRKPTRDALQILERRFFKTARRNAELEVARVNAQVARLIYQLRTDASLSQQELALKIGTTQSVISRLEDDDYGGHSLAMLSKIAGAVGKRLVLSTVDR
jgi:ribosome-binding protein aMBF1 (putative translation factor)